MPVENPDAGEAFDLMVAYYQAHPWKGLAHLLAAVLTGGIWGIWFLSFWYGTMVGWRDVGKMRGLIDK